MGGKGGQTIGFHYMMSLLFGVGRGPHNELVAIDVGDKIAWEGHANDDTVQAISAPNLFGGEQKEGGIQGPFRFFPGRFDQVLPGAGSADCGSTGPMKGMQTLPNVKTTIGGLISEFRNVSMFWFDGLVSSMNPYPKEWKFRLRRHTAGWYNDEPWYPMMARIPLADGTIHAMNPAHIIYQCLTDPAWGRAMPASYIDENSFIKAANTLCSESFGLCILWQRDGTNIDEFINSVQEHIASDLYLDPETGLMTLKLLRNDYIAADLPLFTPGSGLLEITDDDSASMDSNFNEIIGTGRDPITNKDFQIRCYNNASRTALGAPNSQKVDYPGIPTRDLLARVLQRDLRQYAAGLKKFNIALDRRAWRIRRGMPFRIADPRRGLANTVVRAVEIRDNGSKSGRIEMKVMQDIFGMPAASFITPVVATWTPPSTVALPPTASRVLEFNYRDLRLRLPESTVSTLGDVGIIATVALSPDPTMYEYVLATKATGDDDFVERASGAFTGAATLVDPLGPYDTAISVTGVTDFTDDLVGQAVLCDDELIGVTAWDGTSLLTVKRGIADTVPVAHLAAATVWTVDDDATSDQREYTAGETVQAKVLTRASGDLLSPDSAPTLSIDVAGRWEMPYPPADVRVAGDPALAGLGATPPPFTVSWVHRDRLLEADQMVGHTEASVGPEDGTTYNIRTYTDTDPTTATRTVTGLATSWDYDATMWAADGSPTTIWIELEAERDGLVSYQHYRFGVVCVSESGGGTPTLLASIDFKNDVHSIGEDSKTLAEMVEHNTDVGPFDPSTAVVSGVGLRRNTSGSTLPALTAEAFAAITAGGSGFSVVLTVVFTDTSSVFAKALVSFTPASESTAYEGYVRTAGGYSFVEVYDYDSQDESADAPGADVSKAAWTFTPTKLMACADGGDVATTATPQTNAAEMFYLQLQIGGSGPTAIVEKMEFFTPATTAADLQALTV